MASTPFSPPPSDAGDRATSPTLSSSSRTTTSIPTDVSDISSLDGDDFEVIDGPFQPRDDVADGREMDEALDTSRFEGHHDSTIASEIDGSAFIAPAYAVDDDAGWDQHNEGLQASASLTTLLTTLHHEDPAVMDSQSSSLLRFPDPLHASFQEPELDTVPSKDGIRDNLTEDEEEGVVPSGCPVMTPRREQSNFDEKPSSLDMICEDNGPTASPPASIPFHWNKKAILANAFRLIMGLITIIVCTGVLPVWRGTPQEVVTSSTLKQQCTPVSWREYVLRQPQDCNLPSSSSKALMVTPKSHAGVVSTVSSFVAGPTGRASQPLNQSNEVSVGKLECSAVSLYMPDMRSPHRSKCMLGAGGCSAYWRCTVVSLSNPVPASLTLLDIAQHSDGLSRMAWGAAMEKSKVASQNAKVITAWLYKEWEVWVEELDQLYRSLVSPIVEKISRQRMLQIQTTRDAWRHAVVIGLEMMAFMQRAWTDWMADAYTTFFSFTRFVQEESKKAREEGQVTYKVLGRIASAQYKQAQSGLKAVGLQGSAVTQAVYRQLVDKKRALRKAAEKHLDSHEAEKRRWQEVQLLRFRHRQMMAMVREENKLRRKAAKWMTKGKLAFYRKSIQSVQARHRMEDMLDRMTNRNRAAGSRRKLTKSSFRGRRGTHGRW